MALVRFRHFPTLNYMTQRAFLYKFLLRPAQSWWSRYSRVLKFHIWVACEPLADLYFYSPAMKWGGACSFILACTYICPSHFVELYFSQRIKCLLKQYIEQVCTPEFCVQCHSHSCCFRKNFVMVLALFWWTDFNIRTSHKYDNIWNKLCVSALKAQGQVHRC